jgi:hypothetical protein
VKMEPVVELYVSYTSSRRTLTVCADSGSEMLCLALSWEALDQMMV